MLTRAVAAKSAKTLSASELTALTAFDQLPDSAFIRIGVVRALFGDIGNSTVWAWVKSGRLPAPDKLGPQVTAWKVGKLRSALLQVEAA